MLSLQCLSFTCYSLYCLATTALILTASFQINLCIPIPEFWILLCKQEMMEIAVLTTRTQRHANSCQIITTNTSALVFLQARCPFYSPTNSVKALKAACTALTGTLTNWMPLLPVCPMSFCIVMCDMYIYCTFNVNTLQYIWTCNWLKILTFIVMFFCCCGYLSKLILFWYICHITFVL